MRKLAAMTVATVLALLLAADFVSAQQPGGAAPGGRRGARGGEQGAPPGQPGDRGGFDRGRFDPAQMRERMLEGLRERLGATEEEWKAISPLVTDVMEKQGNAMRGGFGGLMGLLGRGGPGGPGRPGGDRGPGAPPGGDQPGQDRGRRGGMFGQPDPEIEALSKTLEDPNASKETIAANLKALRDARAKREAELKAAREKLRAVLTLRQEALLVLGGLLD
ncbi:MAG: hypothetical protein N3D11_06185 [Candidatus Sumerlaeia bacterium]|nr:hypothetical protein [Candidatus Sumerlaeia bacterium]